ncbi:TetR family transcriptional regulator [[Actinomadura] parvosata subsp. kistnae]|uniref:TetR family transcriptional regulator n=1 Tax=[Actinomadura] parvosata subsp. kistnae TaxID=1909395 RepID=A0A1V0AHP3_9ACTN|nr:TetR/AcrR family transcriptional regulator [Nonomuraea sp. ATCC 55076]AQZ69622.1 TetR family transcriptional regulator [Nonomuraea sp. ATCC 55076]
MTMQTRRERVRAEREKLIVSAARELAEAEGWEAVTTRRLAERVEYSQPVLYSHFKGKGAIMTAVAVEGFASMAEELRAARTEAVDAAGALEAVARAYTAFAGWRPALYDAMFHHQVDLPFGDPDAPPALWAAFNELAAAVRPYAESEDELGALAETFWAALHGLTTLMRQGRLPNDGHERRLALLLSRFIGV